MYRGNKDKLAMNHWFDWVGKRQEDLFESVYVLVEDMIKEIVPQIAPSIIKEYFETNPTKIEVNPVIENNIRADLERAISKALK
jgi:hypothetical protein